jgi:hypothetical protein
MYAARRVDDNDYKRGRLFEGFCFCVMLGLNGRCHTAQGAAPPTKIGQLGVRAKRIYSTQSPNLSSLKVLPFEL